MTNIQKNVPAFRSAYTPHQRQQIDFPNPSRTKQSEMASCDINLLMKKYEKDGLVSHLNTHKGQYGDFLGIPEYQDALNQIQAAQDAFMSLPSRIRKRFSNDPAEFVEFAQNPDNADEMVKLGLADVPISMVKVPYADADTDLPPSHEDNSLEAPLASGSPAKGEAKAAISGS